MMVNHRIANLVFIRRKPGCLALIILLALVGCVPAPVPTPDPGALVAAAPSGALAQVLESAAAAYRQETGQAVRVEALGSGEYSAQVAPALLGGMDRYDLVYLSAGDLAHWAAYHAIQPLTGDLDRQALAAYLPAVSVDGKIYGVPTQPDPIGLWYRADLLKQSGLAVPRTWDEFRRAAQAVNAPPGRYGAAISGSDVDGVNDFAALLAGFGGQAVSSDWQVDFDDQAAQAALDFYAGLAGKNAVVAPGADRATTADVVSALREGRAAMGIAPLSARGQLLGCAVSPKVCANGKPLMAWVWLPGLEKRVIVGTEAKNLAVGSLGAWAVPLKAAHFEQAQRFAAWLGSEAGARAWARAGGLPAYPAVLADLPGAEELAQVGEFRLAFPPVATADRLWKAGSAAVSAAVSGEQLPEAALKTAAEEMRKALKQAGD